MQNIFSQKTGNWKMPVRKFKCNFCQAPLFKKYYLETHVTINHWRVTKELNYALFTAQPGTNEENKSD